MGISELDDLSRWNIQKNSLKIENLQTINHVFRNMLVKQTKRKEKKERNTDKLN